VNALDHELLTGAQHFDRIGFLERPIGVFVPDLVADRQTVDQHPLRPKPRSDWRRAKMFERQLFDMIGKTFVENVDIKPTYSRQTSPSPYFSARHFAISPIVDWAFCQPGIAGTFRLGLIGITFGRNASHGSDVS
jgi:hypothetical protein